MSSKSFYLVSACLAGINCRYDGKASVNSKVQALVKDHRAIPVCPEQLGGMPTPREPAEIQGNKVVTKNGEDMTALFEKGAKEGIRIARLAGCTHAILKSKSPSCGCGVIYDGSFTGKLKPGDGIFTQQLKQAGIKVQAGERDK